MPWDAEPSLVSLSAGAVIVKKAAGYGLSRPVALNESPLGRAQNRRVELSKQ